MPNYELCIDLGSSFTTIYKKGCGVVLREPSVVLLDTSNKNSRIVSFGLQAYKENGKLPQHQVLVRPIIEGVIKNLDLTKKMVLYYLNKVIKYTMIKPNIKLIVSLPVALKSNQYETYKNLFYSIGFARIDFVYGVILSSFKENPYYSLGKGNLLIDIGASKTEICSIVNNKIINACSLNVGGDLVDLKIVEYLRKTKNCVISQNMANSIKHEMGSLYETDTSAMEVSAQNLSTLSLDSMVLTAKDLSLPICEIYFKIIQTVQVFLSNCSPEIAEDIKNDGIIIYGGASKITGLEKFFKKILKISVFVVEDPEIFAVSGSDKLFGNVSLLQKLNEEN